MAQVPLPPFPIGGDLRRGTLLAYGQHFGKNGKPREPGDIRKSGGSTPPETEPACILADGIYAGLQIGFMFVFHPTS